MANPPPGWMVRMNVAVLRRKSGAPRSTPISVVTLDGDRYIVSAFSEADWVKNVRAAGTGSLTRGKQTEAVSLVELPDPEREPVLRACLQQVPGGVRFFDSPDPDVVVASASRYPVFRIASVS
jgi:deazaflavin-dependent oxidoreductase (nitroreductase family)